MASKSNTVVKEKTEIEKKAVQKTAQKTTRKTKAKPRQKHLVIVESPAKAKTLKKFLGPNYKIEASMGHVRDLPKSEMGVDVENGFEPKYITIRGKGELLAKLRKEVKDSDIVYLATDPDREGEAISWHLLHALKLDETKASRITFNEVTKNAVKKSIKEARKINMNLVDAQQARRVLDRVVGYKISPLLWRKVKKGLSAGRVQSVTMRLICDREDEIENFTPVEYWTVDAQLETGDGKAVGAKLSRELRDKEETDGIIQEANRSSFTVDEVKIGVRVKKPHPPFTTSTMQQEGSKQLGFAASKTMMVAQQLYEGVDVVGEGTLGLVTYIRTDSVRISDEAFIETREYIKNAFGSEYSVEEKPEYKSKGRSQDAHEAIRPTYINLKPDDLKESLSKEQYKLYNLIWIRFVASLMPPAVYDTVSAKIRNGENIYRASGSVLRFQGYKIVDKKDDDEKSDSNLSLLPELREGEELRLSEVNGAQHFTQPPPRYTEAMLVKVLEENGVGRPSTYAPTITTIVSRNYVTKENKLFYPTELGEIVNDIMKNSFEDIVDIDFTAKMEHDLDRVEDGEIEWKEIIKRFYPPFDGKVKEAEDNLGVFEIKDEESDIVCDLCGRNMVIKFGRFGKFLACPGFPECRNAKPYFEDAEVLCPLCEGRILIKKTKKGRKYYGCENNPECEFMSWNKPTGERCPICGDFLVEKGSKDKRICCQNTKCGYSIEIEDDVE